MEEFMIFSVRVPNDIENKLRILAKKTGRTQSEHIQCALSAYIKELETDIITQKKQKFSGKEWLLDDLEAALNLKN